MKAFHCFEQANKMFGENSVSGCPKTKKKIILSHLEEFMDA